MTSQSENDATLVISYLILRKAIGYLGMALPFVLAFGGMLLDGPGIESSISSYYYTGMRDVFVGTLCAVGVFLFSYKGPDPEDDLAGNLACFAAVGVALFPTTPTNPTGVEQLIGGLHFASAAGFFGILAYFSLALFTRTDTTKW
jgi:hypothetical protein